MMDDERPRQPQVYRLVWKWKMTGAVGAGPWVPDRGTVDALYDSLSARARERAEHWVEVAPARLDWSGHLEPIVGATNARNGATNGAKKTADSLG